ncbi:MAG: tRNA (adenosine(37)-N6)-dimethylallyltransferase MiaA [Planctomycetota bacterium]|nr:tRNA (adenosine(37)-N6)-dimethylallyltransferase MiaA [Planctomycetota bacterium]
MKSEDSQAPLLAVIGPTASGKTALAVELCRTARDRGLSWEVLSLDSMLVYRGLDIGTAKPCAGERGGIAHHLIDLVDPTERFDVQAYLAEASAAEADCTARGVQPLYAGGTAFYLKALLSGLFEGPPVDLALRAELEAEYDAAGPTATHARLVAGDPVLAERLHPNDKKRVVRGLEVLAQVGTPLSTLQAQWTGPARPSRLVGLESPTSGLDERILARTRTMFAAGWPEEAATLRAGPGLGKTAEAALGYAEVLAFVDGELSEEEAIAAVALKTRQFARRQRTWLRRFEGIRWWPAATNAEDLGRMAPEVLEWLLGG